MKIVSSIIMLSISSYSLLFEGQAGTGGRVAPGVRTKCGQNLGRTTDGDQLIPKEPPKSSTPVRMCRQLLQTRQESKLPVDMYVQYYLPLW